MSIRYSFASTVESFRKPDLNTDAGGPIKDSAVSGLSSSISRHAACEAHSAFKEVSTFCVYQHEQIVGVAE
jgi:hypothetical protein